MKSAMINLSEQELYQQTIKMLNERGVTTKDIAELVYFLQSRYFSDITVEDCESHVKKVLEKREVQNAILTGIQLDRLAEKKLLDFPLQEMLYHDESLYGIDETLSLAIINIYGSIGLTNFGYIDKLKPGILKKLDNHENGKVHTFLDDIVGAIAAAASSRIAHNKTSG